MATDKFAKFVHSKRHISTNFLAFCLKNSWTEKNRLFLFDCRSLGEYDRICINDSISVNVLAPILLKRLIVNDTLPLTILVPNCNDQRERFEKFHKTALIVLVVNPTDTFTAEKLYEKFLACDCDVALLNGKVTDFLNEYPQYRATTTAVITFNTSNANIPHSDFYSDSDPTNLNSVSESLINISLASPSVDMKLDDLQPSTSNGGRSGGLTPLEMPSSDWNANENCTPGDENASKRGNGNLFNCRFPVQVMPHLYLGNAENASDLNTLKKNGIKYVLNVTPDLPNTFEKDENFKYMKIPVDDHWSENLSEYFPQAFNFIDEGRHQGVGVLVHCWAGISRSVTVIVAYLMRTLNLSMDDAYDRVKSHKPNIAPNFNFMGQLLDYQRDLYGENVPAGDSSSSVGSAPVDNECLLSPSNNNGETDSRRQQPIDENSLKTIPKPESSTCR